MPTPDVTMRLFVQPIAALMGDPRRGDPEVIYAALCDDLVTASPEALARAVKTIRRDYRWWPALSECLAEVRRAAEEIAAEQAAPRREPVIWPDESSIRWLAGKPVGQMALDGDWHVQLIDFVVRSHRLPTEDEIADFIRQSEALTRRMDEASGPVMERFVRAIAGRRAGLRRKLEEAIAARQARESGE